MRRNRFDHLRGGPRLGSLVAFVVFGSLASGCGDDTASNMGPSPAPPPPPPGEGPQFDIEYGTYLGGGGFEEIREPVLLGGGRLLFGARTLSGNIQTTAGAYQRQHGGGTGDSYLAILSADGSSLEAATYFGGSGMERPAYGIGVASNGDIIFTSGTTSPNLPTSSSSYRRNLHSPVPSPGDGYVCRISGDLSTLRWCSYTGGGWPRGGLSLDAQDNPVVAGRAIGEDFETTPGVVQTQARGGDDAFLLKLRSDGTGAIFSTRLGGSSGEDQEVAMGVRVASDGSVYAAGNTPSSDFPVTSGAAQTSSGGDYDGWIARLSPDATEREFVTLLGGNGHIEGCEHRLFIETDGSVICAGSTDSSNFPSSVGSLSGPRQAHVTKISPTGSAFRSVRLLGGNGDEHLLSPVVDGQGNIYVVGFTTSTDLDVTAGALQTSYGGGDEDGMFFVLAPDGQTVLYATYLGGSGEDFIRGVVVGPDDAVYLVGRTNSSDFPVTEGALQTDRGGQEDGFVIKLVRRN